MQTATFDGGADSLSMGGSSDSQGSLRKDVVSFSTNAFGRVLDRGGCPRVGSRRWKRVCFQKPSDEAHARIGARVLGG